MKSQKLSRVKIIAGKWRGRWIEFPDVLEVRPTPNRVRETLFNWLMTWTPGATCLDAFSGSGALAFEALSRGAEKIVAVEKNPECLNLLKQNAIRLNANNLEILPSDFFDLSNLSSQSFQIIFLDPPFKQNLLLPAIKYLVENNFLAKEHRIYFEVEKEFDLRSLPASIKILKEEVAGQVRYGLLTVMPA